LSADPAGTHTEERQASELLIVLVYSHRYRPIGAVTLDPCFQPGATSGDGSATPLREVIERLSQLCEDIWTFQYRDARPYTTSQGGCFLADFHGLFHFYSFEKGCLPDVIGARTRIPKVTSPRLPICLFHLKSSAGVEGVAGAPGARVPFECSAGRYFPSAASSSAADCRRKISFTDTICDSTLWMVRSRWIRAAVRCIADTAERRSWLAQMTRRTPASSNTEVGVMKYMGGT